MIKNLQSIAVHFGRVGLASLFLLGGVNKIANYSVIAERMVDVDLMPTLLLLPATIALELGGGALLALGVRYAWIAALVLAIFTLATNFYFHRFWELSGPLAELELSLFFKNVAVSGGLVFVAATLVSSEQGNGERRLEGRI